MALIRAGRCAFYGTPDEALDVGAIAAAIAQDVDAMDKLKKYCTGNNYKIGTKPTSAAPTMLDPGVVVSCSFGEKLVRTVFGFMFGREWTATGAEEADDAAIADLRTSRGAIRRACRDMLETGLGRLIVSGSAQEPRVVRFDPRRVFDILDQAGQVVAVVVVTMGQESGKVVRIDLYDDKRHRIVSTDSPDIVDEPHGVGAVPVVTFETVDRRAVFESVLSLIDLHDALMSGGGDEVARWAFSILVAHGAKLSDKALAGAPGTLRVLQFDEPADKVEFLTRSVSIELWAELRRAAAALIHTLSDIPDFASPDFAGVTGTALEYRLIGLETVCGAIELQAADAVRTLAALRRSIATTGDRAPLEVSADVFFPRSKPRDSLYTTQVAAGMKNAGISAEAVTTYCAELLPVADDGDTVSAEMARQRDDVEAQWARVGGMVDGAGQGATGAALLTTDAGAG